MTMQWRAGLVAVAATVVLLAACSSGDGGSNEPESISRLIGAEGGSIELANGGRLEVPPGALNETVSIKITKLELNDVAELPANLEPAGKPYAFEPFDLTFLSPVKLELPFERDESELRPMQLPNKEATTSQWLTVFPSEKAGSGGKLEMQTTSLGVMLAAFPKRVTGYITLPDGAVVPEDAGATDSGSPDAATRDAGTDASVDAAMDANADAAVAVAPWVWIDRLGMGEAEDVLVAPDDRVFVTGTVNGAFPGETQVGYDDVFLRKLDSNGAELWTHQFGTDQSEYPNAVALAASGDLFVGGQTFGAFAGQTLTGDADAFVTKLDSTGVVIWTRQFGTVRYSYVGGLAVDAAGNVIVAGAVGSNGALAGQTSAGLIDIFVRKYDPDGNELWTRQFGTAGHDYGYAVVVDGSGDIFVSGSVDGALAGQTSVGNTDAFVRKYDAAGTELWTHQFGTTDSEYATDMALDGSGNPVVVGSVYGALPGQTSAGQGDGYVRKLNGATGAVLWTQQYGSADEDEALGVAVSSTGHVALVGSTRGALPGKTQSSYRDAYVRKLDQNGGPLWTQQFGPFDGDAESPSTSSAVAFKTNGSVVATGYVAGSVSGASHLGIIGAFTAEFADE